MKVTRSFWVGVLLSLAVPVSNAEAKWIVVPPRPGQIGLSLQGQYQTLANGGGMGSQFGVGPGLSVRLRYRLRYERAIGLSFEHQSFDVRHQGTGEFDPHQLNLVNSSVEFYQLFGTTGRTTRMLSAGLGLTQVSQKLNDGEVQLGGDEVQDGLFLSVGAGLERFIVQSFGLDLNMHYQAIFQNSSTNHEFQAAAGVVFYASY